MSVLKRNVLANFAGSFWQALVSLIFIPVYIHFLGVEGWGLVGFYATLQAMFALLDMGISSTLSREVARLSVSENFAEEIRDIFSTFELLYWGISVLVFAAVFFAADYIAFNWVNASGIEKSAVKSAVSLMGVVIAMQMPIGFYSGGLIGLQKQVALNNVVIVFSTIRAVGAVVVLSAVSSTVLSFFVWQIISVFLNLVVLRYLMIKNIPSPKETRRVRWALVVRTWRFTAGMGGISILGAVLTQIDKVVLSKILSLEDFGYYALGSVVALSLGRIFTPVFNAVYPRFTQLASKADYQALTDLYHKTCQFVAVLIVPVAVLIALFSYEILYLWTQNQAVATKTHVIVSILTIGTAISGILNIPYALQLSFGWTKLSLVKTLLAVIIIVPLTIFMAEHYGPEGAALSWFFLNAAMFLFEIPVMHHRILKGQGRKWYVEDVLFPLLASMPVAFVARALFPSQLSPIALISLLGLTYLVAFLSATLAASEIRGWLWHKLRGEHLQVY